MSLWISDSDVSHPAEINSASICSLQGELCFFNFAIGISTSKELGSSSNGSALCISIYLTSLTLCTFINWEKYFFHIIKTLWGSASRSPFTFLTKLLLGL
jgi:hypothetical protein